MRCELLQEIVHVAAQRGLVKGAVARLLEHEVACGRGQLRNDACLLREGGQAGAPQIGEQLAIGLVGICGLRAVDHRLRLQGQGPLDETVPNLSSFGVDNNDELYVMSLDGPIFRITERRMKSVGCGGIHPPFSFLRLNGPLTH